MGLYRQTMSIPRLYIALGLSLIWISLISAQYRTAPTKMSVPFVSKCCGLEDSDYKIFMKCVNDSATENTAAVSAAINAKPKASSKGGDSKKQIRFGLLTFATEDIFDYSTYGYAINEAFAEHHGYKMKFLHKKLPHYDQQDSRWNKVIVLMDALNSDWSEGLDYLMWLDADLVFLDMYMDLQALVTQYSKAHFIASSEFIGGSTMINSGSCIVKNSKWGRDFLSRWWSFTNRSFYSDQEQFDMMVHSYGLENIDKNVVILPPNIVNSDPPAMEKQLPTDQILHLMGKYLVKYLHLSIYVVCLHIFIITRLLVFECLMMLYIIAFLHLGEHSHLRIRTFKTGFKEICRHLSEGTESVIPQLGMTQSNILKWTLELYKIEMKALMAKYEAKMVDGLNTWMESRKLSNSVHHYCHALKVVGTVKNNEESDMLRKKTFNVLNTNLNNRRRLNTEHIIQYGFGLSEWPEHGKTVAEACGHLTKIGDAKERARASQDMLVLLQEVSDNVTPMQRNAVDSIIAHAQNELSMALMDMQDLDGALKYQKMSLKRMRSVASSSGLHNVIRPLETVANTLSILNRHEEAFAYFEETLDIIHKLYEVEDVSLARVLVNYGLSLYFAAVKGNDSAKKKEIMQASFDRLTEGVQILKRLNVPISDQSHARGVEYITKAIQQGARPKGAGSSGTSTTSSKGKSADKSKANTSTSAGVSGKADSSKNSKQTKKRTEREL